MRTRRLFRGFSLTPDGVKSAYVGGVSASQARYIDADIAYVQAQLSGHHLYIGCE